MLWVRVAVLGEDGEKRCEPTHKYYQRSQLSAGGRPSSRYGTVLSECQRYLVKLRRVLIIGVRVIHSAHAVCGARVHAWNESAQHTSRGVAELFCY